uniref:Integrin alpha second immunoglobulin-like domain-containing protein n=1 Tax=Callorhinchus milii TaxID=7868 RepID=A0A4W3GKM6_CALMI
MCCRDRDTVYLGDRNELALSFEAWNVGEGGAYEAELCVTVPPEADYSGIVHNKSLVQLSCTYENQTVVCDLGNPMKPGTNVRDCGGMGWEGALWLCV